MKNDRRIVMTLDAGGTNFVFTAIRQGVELVDPITLPAVADNLDLCLQTLVEGFRRVRQQLPEPPVAISFAFPGPADYEAGIIGDLPNFPAFRGGVPLGPFLQSQFGVPVFINNDGNLFAYGEAMMGILPEVNQRLASMGSPKRFKNLLARGIYSELTYQAIPTMFSNEKSPLVWQTEAIILSNQYAD